MNGFTLPTFIGIGAPKAGTTWLYRCLIEHPQVFMAAVKETNFFDWDRIDGRLREYEIHFRGADSARAIGEISTRYLASNVAPKRVACLLPSVKLFLSLRNPVQQVYSHYWHLRRQNFHQWERRRIPGSLPEALDTFPDKLVSPARYAEHLERWLSEFPRQQLLVLLHDDLVLRPGDVLRQVYTFIGVDPSFVPQSLTARGSEVRAGSSPKSELHGRVETVLYDLLNRRIYHPLKRVFGVSHAIVLKERLRVREGMERIFQRRGYPPLSEADRAAIVAAVATDLDRLEQVVGLDLDAWRGSAPR